MFELVFIRLVGSYRIALYEQPLDMQHNINGAMTSRLCDVRAEASTTVLSIQVEM